MTTSCGHCGAKLTAEDKFCGDCGRSVEVEKTPAMAAPNRMVPPPPQPQQFVPAEPPQPEKRRGALLLLGMLAGIILGVGAALAGFGYYAGWFGGTAATNGATDTVPAPEKTLPKPASEVPTEEASEDIDALKAEEQAIAQLKEQKAREAKAASMVIKPGRWHFESEVTSALLQGTTIPARPNGRTLLGHKSTFKGCISKNWVKNPTKQMMLAQVGYGKDCRHRKATMANGKYEATMMCPQPPDGAGYQVRFVGDYDETNINMTAFSTVTIGQGVNEVDGKAKASLVALVNGRYVGPCK